MKELAKKDIPVLIMGMNYHKDTMAFEVPAGTTVHVIDSLEQARFAYTSAFTNPKVVFFISDDWFLGLDIRFGRDAEAIVMSHGEKLLSKEELM